MKLLAFGKACLIPRRLSRKLLILMKLTITLLLFATLSVHAKGYSQKVTVAAKNISLTQVLEVIKKQTGYKFVCDDRIIEKAGKITVNFRETPLQTALTQCLTGLGLHFEIKYTTIIITRGEQSLSGQLTTALSTMALPADTAIRGKITDEKGTPIPGVSVVIKGTAKGTATDNNGQYKLDAGGHATLVFTSLGFKPQEIPVNGKTTINLTLESSASDLDQIVVVGYGTQKKTSVTAAVSTLKGEDVAATPVTNLSNSIGGRLSGVIVKQNSGEPGLDGSNIFIRGISSTGNNQPLLIVDNIPRSFQQLDPNTIESITVLKDAAAVAPYGVAGANGVILVTTKRGKTGAPTLSYKGYIGFQNPTVLPKYVDAVQFATLKNAAAKNAGLPLPYTQEEIQKYRDGSDRDAYPNDDVFKEIINKNAILTTHSLELSGGTDKVNYYTSIGYQHQEGMWKPTSHKRYNLAMNLDAKATKTTKISFNLNGRVQQAASPPISSGRLFELVGFAIPSHGPLVYSNGMYGTYVMGSLYNSGYFKGNTTAIYSQLSIEQQLPFVPGLSAKGTVAYDPTIYNTKIWTTPVHMATIDKSQQPYKITDGIFGQTQPSLTQNLNNSQQLTYQASLNYSRSFGKNNVGALALFEAKANNAYSLEASRRNYILYMDDINMGSSSQADMSTGGSSSAGRQVGLVYRVTYDYADKYLFEASGRYDGSYYFAPENRFGFFPAFSVGWRLSEEQFMKGKVSWVDNLKLRGSYGEVGALAGGAFQYLSTYNVLGTTYVLGKNAVQGISERAEPNPNITWERAKKTDIGLEATLWKGLLGIEIDYFYEKRSNMLVNPDVVVPLEYGVGLSQVNAGIMKNQGIDFSISSSHRFSKDLLVSLRGNFTYAKNTLLQIFESSVTYNNPNRRLTGKSLGTQFGFKSLGYFQVTDFDQDGNLKPGIATQPWGKVEPGDIRYEDISGDGKINDDDLTAIGDPVATPRIIYGISPTIQYKGFSLELLFQGAAKTNWYYHPSAIMPFFNGMHAYVDNMDYWTAENPNARNPRLTTAPTANNSQTSSFWMGNAAYLRLKSAILAYNLPAHLTHKIGIQHIQVYASGQNIFTWTKLKNFDPEIGPNSSYIPNGGWSYPQQKVLAMGLNVTF